MLALRRAARLAFCQWRGILHDPRSGTSAVCRITVRSSCAFAPYEPVGPGETLFRELAIAGFELDAKITAPRESGCNERAAGAGKLVQHQVAWPVGPAGAHEYRGPR
jgi:hypothetical protein